MESPSYIVVEKAIDFIRSHYTLQPSLDEVAEHVHLSKFHFQKLFQDWAGVSPKTFLQHVTLQNAKALLAEGKSTFQTSLDLGLTGNGRLHDLFVKMEAVTPGEFKSMGEGLTICWQIISSVFGNVLIAETDRGLCHAVFTDEKPERHLNLLKEKFCRASVQEKPGKQIEMIREYFEQWKTPSQNILLDLKGTPFQVKVWKALLEIPEGKLLTYSDMAKKVGNEKASRAVGTAIGSNCLAMIIPCHRVIRQNGELGGYRWGENRKAAIIAYEQVRKGV